MFRLLSQSPLEHPNVGVLVCGAVLQCLFSRLLSVDTETKAGICCLSRVGITTRRQVGVSISYMHFTFSLLHLTELLAQPRFQLCELVLAFQQLCLTLFFTVRPCLVASPPPHPQVQHVAHNHPWVSEGVEGEGTVSVCAQAL